MRSGLGQAAGNFYRSRVRMAFPRPPIARVLSLVRQPRHRRPGHSRGHRPHRHCSPASPRRRFRAPTVGRSLPSATAKAVMPTSAGARSVAVAMSAMAPGRPGPVPPLLTVFAALPIGMKTTCKSLRNELCLIPAKTLASENAGRAKSLTITSILLGCADSSNNCKPVRTRSCMDRALPLGTSVSSAGRSLSCPRSMWMSSTARRDWSAIGRPLRDVAWLPVSAGPAVWRWPDGSCFHRWRAWNKNCRERSPWRSKQPVNAPPPPEKKRSDPRPNMENPAQNNAASIAAAASAQ